jgi:hypothetical protein
MVSLSLLCRSARRVFRDPEATPAEYAAKTLQAADAAWEARWVCRARRVLHARRRLTFRVVVEHARGGPVRRLAHGVTANKKVHRAPEIAQTAIQ